MFKTIDFTKEGGFPLTQNAMEFIQQSYNEVLSAVARMAGQYVIITGVTETSPNVYSNGWVSFDGKIVPFIGGIGQPNVDLTGAVSGLTFRNGSTPIVYTSYTASFSATGVPFLNFQRLTLSVLKTQIDSVSNTANDALALAEAISAGTQSFATGMIMMFNGTTPPSGWGLCDGLDGRPNLKGRFIVGYDAGDVDYNAIAKLGGSKTVGLVTANLPSHTHSISSDGSHTHSLPSGQQFAAWINNEADAGSGSSGNEVSGTAYPNTTSAGSHSHGGATGSAGSGTAHENRPPYYTLAYIIKL